MRRIRASEIQRNDFAFLFGVCFNRVSTLSYSFYLFLSRTAVNVAFAIDLTQSEKAVDPDVIQQYVKDVELAIRAIGEPLRDFNVSNSYAAFGFGAKIPPHFRESQEFCLVSFK
jgi:hypothetical protein